MHKKRMQQLLKVIKRIPIRWLERSSRPSDRTIIGHVACDNSFPSLHYPPLSYLRHRGLRALEEFFELTDKEIVFIFDPRSYHHAGQITPRRILAHIEAVMETQPCTKTDSNS